MEIIGCLKNAGCSTVFFIIFTKVIISLPSPIILSDWLRYSLLNNALWNNHSWLGSCSKLSHTWRVQKVWPRGHKAYILGASEWVEAEVCTNVSMLGCFREVQ